MHPTKLFFNVNELHLGTASAQVLWHTSLPTATTTPSTLVLSKRKMLEHVKGKGSGARRARGKRRSLIKPRHSNHALSAHHPVALVCAVCVRERTSLADTTVDAPRLVH
jgi:hypothetical protein